MRKQILQAKCESAGFRFQNFKIDWDDFYTCRTCDKRAKLKTILSHLQIQKHRSAKKVCFTFLCELYNVLEVHTFDNNIKKPGTILTRGLNIKCTDVEGCRCEKNMVEISHPC